MAIAASPLKHASQNDNACREIVISPTMDEFLCPEKPYLPANRPGAPNHLPAHSVDRLLDTHFRLLRNDLMGPLLDSVQKMLAKSDGISFPGTIASKVDQVLSNGCFVLLHLHV
jgi:hypothetical protein